MDKDLEIKQTDIPRERLVTPAEAGEAAEAVKAVEAAVYLFPVPLDNEEPLDRSLPSFNLRPLMQIKHYVVENVRSARRFLRRCSRDIDIDSLHFTVLDEHTPAEDVAAMLHPLEKNGVPIGVISEAGCPAVADPGADLVAVAQRKGLKVVPLVGPSSILLALMGSGFNGQSFAFNGYLPIHQPQRGAKLREMEQRIRQGQTQIFIETPYRNNRLIAELSSTLPSTLRLCVASDLTGRRESIRTLPLSRWKTEKYDFDKIPTIFLLFT